ncbi:hypothetical protein QBC39DRAFT_378426 [Podospora conica]|nr:hypothetical protein QBC39DRAFT_378426 [Schizothecium conicum]
MMADTTVSATAFPVAREFEIDRINDHLAFIRRFKQLLEDVRYPGPYANLYPKQPPGTSPQDAGTWRVQCLLMNAEIRYSLYLQLLEDWASKRNRSAKTLTDWPVPPWDVALIFYTHLLTPQKFTRDLAAFPSLLPANLTFPLARLAHHPATSHDSPSAALWKAKHPSIPYQVLTHTPSPTAPKWHPTAPLDIHAYRCGAHACATARPPKTHTLPLALWSAHRLGLAVLPCPSCRAVFTKLVPSPGRTFFEHCLRAFGVPVFDLWWTPLRQFGRRGFVDAVLGLVDGGTPEMQARYVKFLGLMRGLVAGDKGVLVPTVDVDLVWHTHQLAPGAYGAYCGRWVGRSVFHDDSVAGGERGRGLLDTQVRWARAYGEAMMAPGGEERKEMIAERRRRWEELRAKLERELGRFDADEANVALKRSVEVTGGESRVAQQKVLALRREVEGYRDRWGNRKDGVYGVKKPLGPWMKDWYSTSGRRRWKENEEQREAAEKQLAALGKQADDADRKHVEARDKQAVSQRMRDSLTAENNILISRAEEDFNRAAVVASLPADPGKGPAHAVIGTEAQMEMPVLGKPQPLKTARMLEWGETILYFPMTTREEEVEEAQGVEEAGGGWLGVVVEERVDPGVGAAVDAGAAAGVGVGVVASRLDGDSI